MGVIPGTLSSTWLAEAITLYRPLHWLMRCPVLPSYTSDNRLFRSEFWPVSEPEVPVGASSICQVDEKIPDPS